MTMFHHFAIFDRELVWLVNQHQVLLFSHVRINIKLNKIVHTTMEKANYCQTSLFKLFVLLPPKFSDLQH